MIYDFYNMPNQIFNIIKVDNQNNVAIINSQTGKYLTVCGGS
jgi:hypothetical protein